jgi:excisionase family DNA binding protein
MRLTDKALLTYDEAAIVLNVSKSYVQKLLRDRWPDGSMKLIRVEVGPQKKLIPMTSISEYIARLVEDAMAKADQPAA